jgi:hypothetical protein
VDAPFIDPDPVVDAPKVDARKGRRAGILTPNQADPADPAEGGWLRFWNPLWMGLAALVLVTVAVLAVLHFNGPSTASQAAIGPSRATVTRLETMAKTARGQLVSLRDSPALAKFLKRDSKGVPVSLSPAERDDLARAADGARASLEDIQTLLENPESRGVMARIDGNDIDALRAFAATVRSGEAPPADSDQAYSASGASAALVNQDAAAGPPNAVDLLERLLNSVEDLRRDVVTLRTTTGDDGG